MRSAAVPCCSPENIKPVEASGTTDALKSIRYAALQVAVSWLQIDAQTCELRADGPLLTCDPAALLPMAQRYFLF